jgi:hypothetical protein
MPNKSDTPRRKRLTKQVRLSSAKSWINKYSGKNIISGYAKWYGVNKICALSELKSLGIIIQESLENQIIASHQSRIEQKRIIREKKKTANSIHIESDDNFAFIVGYTSGGFPYGLTHDEMDKIEIDENTN